MLSRYRSMLVSHDGCDAFNGTRDCTNACAAIEDACVGLAEGDADGEKLVGFSEGCCDGAAVGPAVGVCVGFVVGISVGLEVGCNEGASVGPGVDGALDGAAVGHGGHTLPPQSVCVSFPF